MTWEMEKEEGRTDDVEGKVRTKAPKKLFLGSSSPLLKCAQCSLEI